MQKYQEREIIKELELVVAIKKQSENEEKSNRNHSEAVRTLTGELRKACSSTTEETTKKENTQTNGVLHPHRVRKTMEWKAAGLLWYGKCIAFLLTLILLVARSDCVTGRIVKRSYSDQSVHGYMTERTCWWNEVCKEEFQSLFRCKCPQFSYCRSPGRYYNAYCSMADTGYIWTQPTWEWAP